MTLDRRWISPKQASEYCGCHIQTLYFWVSSGVVPSARLGRKVLIDKKRLDEMLESQITGQAPGGRR
jgi:excisionase family DNA binding protein